MLQYLNLEKVSAVLLAGGFWGREDDWLRMSWSENRSRETARESWEGGGADRQTLGMIR